jgi:hypothetical protein
MAFLLPSISNLYFLRGALTVLKFFDLVVILVFEDKILMYIALNTALFAERSLKQLVISFRGFPLAVCASQAGSLAACASQVGSL